MEPLSIEEVRVLASLVEKAATVPDSYPLTLNALRQACNQTSARQPVVAYDEQTVRRALDSLKAGGLVRFVHPSHGERVIRYRHVVHERLDLEPPELAVLAALALRGPQTPSELYTRTERAHAFASITEVESVLTRLTGRDDRLVVVLPRQVGQHQARWAHQLGGPVDVDAVTAAPVAPRPQPASDRLGALEAEVAALRARLDRLEQQLGVSTEPSL
jgi:uncharacterized protein